mgnify:CR=1 FL=1
MIDDSPPRVGDLVKMKIDIERGGGQVGVVHKVRTLSDPDLPDRLQGNGVYEITWSDVRSIQYLSEIVVVARN